MAKRLVELFYENEGKKTSQDLITDAEDIVVKSIKVVDANLTEVFSVSPAGTVKHGKSRVEMTETVQGIILKSANQHRWKIEVSDTGQLVTTDLGLE